MSGVPEPSEDDDRFVLGVQVATARLVGVVAVALGEKHPVIERMVIAVGELLRDG